MNRISMPSLLIAVGSLLFFGSELLSAETQQPTFNKDIAPLVFQHCSACHRPGEVAPFSLLTYADAKKRARMIDQLTSQRRMPPWKSAPGHVPFIGERRLTDEQIALLHRWVEAGTPEGNAADLPPQPQFTDGWKLGKPDLVIRMPEPFEVPAEGNDIYRNFVFSLELPPGKYIQALEYQPSNRTVVHHAAFTCETTGRARQQDQEDPLPGYKGGLNLPGRILPGNLAIWVPGRDPSRLASGFSYPWKPGADLVMQLHLHPSGKPEKEQSSFALYLTDEPPQRSLIDVIMLDTKIDIPPGEKQFKTRSEVTLPLDTELTSIFPHMHLIGKEIKLTAYLPSGERQPLLVIDDWDFAWQSIYECARPVKLPAGTRLVLEGVHDNSAENIRNPVNPPRRVTWGEQTTNEMTAAFLQLIPASETEYAALTPQQRGRFPLGIVGKDQTAVPVAGRGMAAAAGGKPPLLDAALILKKVDRDNDGQLTVDELVTASGKTRSEIEGQVTRFDKNADNRLDVDELRTALQTLLGK